MEASRYLKTAESLTCPYVWGRYDVLVLPASFPYGGMENSNLTFVRLFSIRVPRVADRAKRSSRLRSSPATEPSEPSLLSDLLQLAHAARRVDTIAHEAAHSWYVPSSHSRSPKLIRTTQVRQPHWLRFLDPFLAQRSPSPPSLPGSTNPFVGRAGRPTRSA